MVVSGIAVLVRRFYDTERSGWWALAKTVSYAVILSGGSFTGLGTRLGQLPGAVFVVAVALLLGFVFTCFFVFLCVVSGGTQEPNCYGPDLYGRNELEEVFA
jgi:uncharacterized membrane protein YhaH (DUF805 family)